MIVQLSWPLIIFKFRDLRHYIELYAVSTMEFFPKHLTVPVFGEFLN